MPSDHPEAFLRRVEAAQPDEFHRILIDPSPHNVQVLRTYFGEEQYRRLHDRALRHEVTRSRGPARQERGNVVVIHGIMGGELTALQGQGAPGPGKGRLRTGQVWLRLFRLAGGGLRTLKLDASGHNESDASYRVVASGILKKYYGEQLEALFQNGWNVRAFWFDWRKSLDAASDDLHRRLIEWFGRDAPVHLVAHSMGGLVARTFIANYRDHWETLWDADGKGKKGGRLIMLGTPNHGSWEVPQILTGVQRTVRMLALLDLGNSIDEVLDVVNTFPGTYQMLPSPLAVARNAREAVERLYRADAYGPRVHLTQDRFDAALAHHEKLREVVDPERMVYVAGDNEPTYCGLDANTGDRFLSRLGRRARRAYVTTREGDGKVSHACGLLKGVPTYYVEEEHGGLPQNERVMAALNDLLEEGKTTGLETASRTARLRSSGERGLDDGEGDTEEKRHEAMEEKHRREENELQALLSLGRRRLRGPAAEQQEAVSVEERMAAELILRGTLSDPAPSDSGTRPAEAPEAAAAGPSTLKIAVVCDDIGGMEYLRGEPPVDAVSVGHYRGVRPIHAELALDRAVTAGLRRRGASTVSPSPDELLLTNLSERGTLQGGLGQTFFVPDYRDDTVNRIFALAGMGDPGRFGIPELTVVARELLWSLGQMEKQHLATVLIGSGNGNLSVEDAVTGWLRGIERALADCTSRQSPSCVQQVTFVELQPGRAVEIDEALRRAVARENGRTEGLVRFEHEAFTPEKIDRLAEAERERQVNALAEQMDALKERRMNPGQPEPQDLPATRLTVSHEGDVYRYGALTNDASVPERDLRIDPRLVHEANDLLVTEWSRERQIEIGRLLEQLIIPNDFRSHLGTSAPLVLLLDTTTAQIHWEMLAQPDVGARPGKKGEALYFGLNRGFTRQLRTGFAPPPEPPPPPHRVLRVLVVADPAADARLDGAQEEGVEVADLFDMYNRLHAAGGSNRVEVTRLIGPYEATRLNVMKALMQQPYDVLHFAGHCIFDQTDVAASGWIFSDANRQTLSARELQRIDRVPAFVFSNACESGRTPDRQRTAALAPSFAEAFFLKGVTNFVCTAWPVDDQAARRFAQVLYGCLLGIAVQVDAETKAFIYQQTAPAPLHKAMQVAREAVYGLPNGYKTWGAYQHYGNPYYRFFNVEDERGEHQAAAHEDVEARAADVNGTNGRAQQEKGKAKRKPAAGKKGA